MSRSTVDLVAGLDPSEVLDLYSRHTGTPSGDLVNVGVGMSDALILTAGFDALLTHETGDGEFLNAHVGHAKDDDGGWKADLSFAVPGFPASATYTLTSVDFSGMTLLDGVNALHRALACLARMRDALSDPTVLAD